MLEWLHAHYLKFNMGIQVSLKIFFEKSIRGRETSAGSSSFLRPNYNLNRKKVLVSRPSSVPKGEAGIDLGRNRISEDLYQRDLANKKNASACLLDAFQRDWKEVAKMTSSTKDHFLISRWVSGPFSSSETTR